MIDSDPTDLLEQDAQADSRRTAADVLEKQEDEDFAWIMSGPRGRRFVRRLLDRASPLSTSFNTNALAMACAEGAKQISYWLLAEIDRLCPEAYTQMNQEHEKKNG